METLMKADIFFFVATIQSIVIGLLLCVVLYYIIKIMRTLDSVSKALQERIDDSDEYVAELRKRLEGNFIFRFLFPPLTTVQKKRKTAAKSGE